jgi:dTDP-4-amino-4,6-dideoxygalactose transaminase
MIEEIDLTKFPLSGQISQEILNFPVHQDTSIEDIETLTTAIDDFFKLVNYES